MWYTIKKLPEAHHFRDISTLFAVRAAEPAYRGAYDVLAGLAGQGPEHSDNCTLASEPEAVS